MMYYRVTTKFYDDGKVDVLVDTVYKKEQPKNFSCEFKETCTVIFLTAGATQPSSQNRQKMPSLQMQKYDVSYT